MEEDSRLARASCMGVVEKMSGLGYTFHKRFLCLDEGVLSYYSKVPQQAEREGFDMNILKALAAKPKFAIEIKHIKTIRPADPALCEKKKKKYMFIIEFQKSLLMSPSKGEGDSSQSPERGKDGMELEWVFAVQSESELSQWVSILECEREIEVQPEQPVQQEDEPPVFIPKRTSLTERFEVKSFPNHEKEYNRNFEKNYSSESKNRRIRRGRREGQEIAEKPQDREHEDKNEMEKQLFEDFQFLNDEIPHTNRDSRDNEIEQQQSHPTLELLNETVARENEQQPQKPVQENFGEEDDSSSYKVRETEICQEITVNYNNENEKMARRNPNKIRNQDDDDDDNDSLVPATAKDEKNEPTAEGAAANSLNSLQVKPISSVEEKEVKLLSPQNQNYNEATPSPTLNKDWEQKLNTLMKGALATSTSSRDSLKYEFEILKILGQFEKKAAELSKQIINELYLPPLQRVYGTKEITSFEDNLERIFYVENLIVKITWTETKHQHDPPYLDESTKLYGHDLRAANLLNDITLRMNKNYKDLVFRVPLATVIDYKGFRCFVTTQRPTRGEETLQVGPIRSTGGYRVNPLLVNDLKRMAEIINMKEHQFISKDKAKSIKVPLSIFTEVHKHSFDKGDFYYFSKAGDIYPLDVNVEEMNKVCSAKRLRHEFVSKYQKPIAADILLTTEGVVGNEKEVVELIEACEDLRKSHIPDFVNRLDSLEFVIIDSESLTEAFHSSGVNMRYLGLVAHTSSLSYWKRICETEMIARVIKKILRKHLSDIMLKRDSSRKASWQEFDSHQQHSSTGGELDLLDKKLAECVVEILNLVFGCLRESEIFWQDVIVPQILSSYNYTINNLGGEEFNFGGLLHAISYHCGLKLDLKNISPSEGFSFLASHFLGFQTRSKTFTMKDLEIKSLGERYQEARLRGDLEGAKKFGLLMANTERQLASNDREHNPRFCGEFAEIILESGDLDKAYEQAQVGEANSRENHSEVFKCLCVMIKIYLIRDEFEMAIQRFDQAIAILNSQHGESSPLHITIYNILGRSYLEKGRLEDAMILYKLSLGCCLKTLGPLHSCTGTILWYLGHLSLQLEQWNEALKCLQQAYNIEFSRAEGNPLLCADLQHLLSVTRLRLGDLDGATTAVFDSVNIYESQGGHFPDKLLDCYLQIIQISERKNDLKMILEYSNKAFKILSHPSFSSRLVQEKKMLLNETLKAVIKSFPPEKINSLQEICQSLLGAISEKEKTQKLSEEELQQFFEKSKLSKNLQNFLKEMFNLIYQGMKDRDLLLFCKDYVSSLENLEDIQLEGSLEAFETLARIQGAEKLMENFIN